MIDDLSVRYYVDSSWVYAFVDDFDWGLDGFVSQVPVYDGNGNLTYDGSRVYTYDSWNRLAAVSLALPDDTLTPADADGDPDIGPVIAEFYYDGLGRRVSKVVTNSGSWNDEYDYYYDGWKLIETRNLDSDICGQYLWGLGYIDELCLIRWQFDALAVRQTRDYYALQYANYNVLGVVDAVGDLVERYDYTPYGERRVYNHHHIVLSDYDDDGDVDLDDFITCNQNFGLTDATHDQGDSDGDGDVDTDDFILMKQEYGYVAQTGDALLYQFANESLTERGDMELCPFGHQGLFYDKETGLYNNRARYLYPAFGRFTSNDPIGTAYQPLMTRNILDVRFVPDLLAQYADGANLYQYEMSTPLSFIDPVGQQRIRGNKYGDWDITQINYNAYLEQIYKSDVDIKFIPNKDTVCCEEISFIQIARMVDQSGVFVDTPSQRRKTSSGWSIDMQQGFKQPWYLNDKDGKPSETYGKAGSAPVPYVIAELYDTVIMNKWEVKVYFETAAICKKGKDAAGAWYGPWVYGSLSWGFNVDGKGQLTSHFPSASGGLSVDFWAAIEAWDEQAYGPESQRNHPDQEPIGNPIAYP